MTHIYAATTYTVEIHRRIVAVIVNRLPDRFGPAALLHRRFPEAEGWVHSPTAVAKTLPTVGDAAEVGMAIASELLAEDALRDVYQPRHPASHEEGGAL